LCRAEGQALSGGEKVVQRELATIGFELDAVTAAASPAGAVLHLRRRDPIVCSFEDLVGCQTLAPEMASFLTQCLLARANILVVGVRGGGYTQVMAALAEAAPGSAFSLRDEWELAYHGSSIFPLTGEGEELAQLLAVAQRFSTHHWLVDGMGRGRAPAILAAIAEGMTGVVAGIKGRSLEHGLLLFKSQLSLSGVKASDFGSLIAASFDVAVEVVSRPEGVLITRIAELNATDAGVYPQDIFSFNGHSLKTNPRTPRFVRDANARGIPLGAGLFDEV
jgi:pilus assembly protein CpaF